MINPYDAHDVWGSSEHCIECGEALSPSKAYTVLTNIEGRIVWITGHKYCLMAYTNRKEKELIQKMKNYGKRNLLSIHDPFDPR